jgi:hypothetical protein
VRRDKQGVYFHAWVVLPGQIVDLALFIAAQYKAVTLSVLRVSGYLSTFSPITATFFVLSFFANCSSDRELTSWPCS